MFEQKVFSFIQQIYPNYNKEECLVSHRDHIHKADDFFNQLLDIYEEREKYNLHWAFKQASKIFKEQTDESHDRIVETLPGYDEKFNQVREKVQQQIGKTTNIYSWLSSLVSFIDIVISVALILVVTLVSQVGEHALNNFVLTILFIAVIALVKVSLDRFLIIPKVEAWGWRRYLKITTGIIDIAASITAMRMVIVEYYKTNKNKEENLDHIVKLCKRGFEAIKNENKFLKVFMEKILKDIRTSVEV